MSSDLVMASVIVGSIVGYNMMMGGVVGFLLDRHLGDGDGFAVPLGMLWPAFVLAAAFYGPMWLVARALGAGKGDLP